MDASVPEIWRDWDGREGFTTRTKGAHHRIDSSGYRHQIRAPERSLDGGQEWIAGREEERKKGPQGHVPTEQPNWMYHLVICPLFCQRKRATPLEPPLCRPEDYTWTVSQPEQVEKKLRWTPGGDRKRACRRQSERVSSHSQTLPDGK